MVSVWTIYITERPILHSLPTYQSFCEVEKYEAGGCCKQFGSLQRQDWHDFEVVYFLANLLPVVDNGPHWSTTDPKSSTSNKGQLPLFDPYIQWREMMQHVQGPPRSGIKSPRNADNCSSLYLDAMWCPQFNLRSMVTPKYLVLLLQPGT